MENRASFETAGAYSPDQLIAGNAHLLVARTVTLLAGTAYVRGMVLGKVTASSKFTLSASAAADGSEDPDVVLAETVDATDGDRQGLIYSRGDFSSHAVTLGAGHTLAAVTEALRAKGIAILPSMPV